MTTHMLSDHPRYGVDANRAQYRLARNFLARARASSSPYVRRHLVLMALACRTLIARNRSVLRQVA